MTVLLLAAIIFLAMSGMTSPTKAVNHIHILTRHDESFQPDSILRVSQEDIQTACKVRPSVVVNGTSPGPQLRIKPGRTTWIRVYNDMADSNVTMHWHGLSQRTAPFADGTPQLSQWPIAAGHFFDYEVHPGAHDAGTYFYHSHVDFQAVTATGALIVDDDGPPPYQYEEELLLEFTDYLNKTDKNMTAGLLASPFQWSGETNAILLNGVGVADVAKAGTPGCELPVINVEAGKTYRMRFLGETAISMVSFGIANHTNFTIVAADGQYTIPYTADHMQVSSGQRFDAIFQTKATSELRGQTDFLIQFESKTRPEIYYGYGVLRYAPGIPQITEAPTTPQLRLSNLTYDWLEYALEPLSPTNFPAAHEVTRRIEIYNRQVEFNTAKWIANGVQWNNTSPPYPGDVPYLIEIYNKGQKAVPNYEASLNNSGWDPKTSTWPAKIGEVLEIIWYNTGSLVDEGRLDYHPFHAHGTRYWDIGSGNGTYNPTANEEKLKGYNPVLRDTTNLYLYPSTPEQPLSEYHNTVTGRTQGWRGSQFHGDFWTSANWSLQAWRLRVDDPGVWMFHCHILPHMIMGMQTVWVMGNYEDIVKIPHDAAAWYLEFGGDAYGNGTFWPSYVHHFP